MKKESSIVQIGVVALSTVLLFGIVVFSFKLAADYSAADMLSPGAPNFQNIVAPIDYEARIAKGNSLLDAGYYTLAASEYAYSINIQPENPEAYVKLGASYLKLNENDKAAEQFAKAMELDPENVIYQLNYAIALMRNKQFQEAATILAELPDENASVALYKGIAATLEDDLNLAEKYFETSGSNDFQNAFASYKAQQEGQEIYLKALIAKALVDANEYEIAEELTTQILNQKNDYRDVWILLGYSKLKTKEYQDAEDAFKQAKKLDSVKTEIHYFLGMSHYMQEEYQDAIKSFELALLYGFQPENEVYQKLAECYAFEAEYEDSLAAYEYLLDIDRQNVSDFVKPVWIAIDVMQDLERAMNLANEAVSSFPNEAMSHNLLGWTQLETGDLTAAATSLDQAITLNPYLAAAHYNKGRLHEINGATQDAKNSYKLAHELASPDDDIGRMAAEKYNSLILSGQEAL